MNKFTFLAILAAWSACSVSLAQDHVTTTPPPPPADAAAWGAPRAEKLEAETNPPAAAPLDPRAETWRTEVLNWKDARRVEEGGESGFHVQQFNY